MPLFYETPTFHALEQQWRRRLAESGFRDIESPDGQYVASKVTSMVHLDGTAMDAVATTYRGVVETSHALAARARDVLSDAGFWDGLPEECKRLWALIVLGDWEPKAAARQLGVSERCERRWLAEVRVRLERRRPL